MTRQQEADVITLKQLKAAYKKRPLTEREKMTIGIIAQRAPIDRRAECIAVYNAIATQEGLPLI